MKIEEIVYRTDLKELKLMLSKQHIKQIKKLKHNYMYLINFTWYFGQVFSV